MDLISILETFGLPVFMIIALGYYVNRQNNWIQTELQKELRESFNRLEQIVIKLIDNSKKGELSTEKLTGKLNTMISIFTKIVKDINERNNK